MSRFRLRFALPVVLAALVLTTAMADTPAPESWREKMREFAAILNQLLPELVARQPDRRVVLDGSKALAEIAHAVHQDAASPMTRRSKDFDASLPILAEQLAQDASTAYAVVEHGQLDYGTELLRSVTGHCIACHTRHAASPDSMGFQLSPAAAALGRTEQADLLAATRNFDKALAEYQAITADEEYAQAQPLEWERAVRNGLALAVRVEQNPDAALRISDSVAQQTAAPEFLRSDALRWRAAGLRWKAERSAADIDPPTASLLYEQMKRLYAEAMATLEYPADHAANVEFLRASAAAHDLLARFPDTPHAAEALYIIGESFDVTGDPMLWQAPERYFETCVRTAPHSYIAALCFERYEQSVYIGYSGSGGVFMPEHLLRRMSALRRMAAPEG